MCDDETSPCIDAGDPEDYYCKEPNPNGGRIDMGAYGNTPEAPKSYRSGRFDGLNVSIKANNIAHCNIAVCIGDCTANSTISENNITGGTVAFLTCSASSLQKQYKTFHNNFIGNGMPAFSGTSTIRLDGGYPCGGNYWSDYAGGDLFWDTYQNVTGSDGIGDTPYIIDSRNRDNYPLMSRYEYWSNPIRGDINKDTNVDSTDLSLLTASYGSSQETPNWNPYADLNNDLLVDTKDLFILGTNYGKSGL